MMIPPYGPPNRSLLSAGLLGVTKRRVYFSFHFERDIRRIQIVRNHWVADTSHEARGFFDGSLREKAKRETDLAVKRAINQGMIGSSVVCVLSGTETWTRRWVKYEIFRAIQERKGLFVVRVHNIKDPNYGRDNLGPNPLDYLGYAPSVFGKNLNPYHHDPASGKLEFFKEAEPISARALKGLPSDSPTVLSTLFPVYDWYYDNGRANFSDWARTAALLAS